MPATNSAQVAVLDELARRGARWLAFLARLAQAEQAAHETEADPAEGEHGTD